jgi:hypothetical protein
VHSVYEDQRAAGECLAQTEVAFPVGGVGGDDDLGAVHLEGGRRGLEGLGRERGWGVREGTAEGTNIRTNINNKQKIGKK